MKVLRVMGWQCWGHGKAEWDVCLGLRRCVGILFLLELLMLIGCETQPQRYPAHEKMYNQGWRSYVRTSDCGEERWIEYVSPDGRTMTLGDAGRRRHRGGHRGGHGGGHDHHD